MREWRRGPLHRPRSVRCPETDALAPRPLPVRSARAVPRGCAPSRTAFGSNQRVSPRATAFVGNSTLCGIQSDFVGFHGYNMENAGFLQLLPVRADGMFPACSGVPPLWISL